MTLLSDEEMFHFPRKNPRKPPDSYHGKVKRREDTSTPSTSLRTLLYLLYYFSPLPDDFSLSLSGHLLLFRP